MTQPRITLLRRNDTHRLVPSRYRRRAEGVLARIADDDAHLAAILELDDATDDRLRAERDLLPGIGIDELVFGVPHHRIVNAAFCHAQPLGSRFNSPDRGAWYAAFELQTAQAEVAFHKAAELAEVGWREEESVTYDDYLADFSAQFHDLRGDARFASCLDPDSYVASQRLAQRLLAAGSLGIVHPSVRRRRGTSIACFRPALVVNVRKARTYRLVLSAGAAPRISVLR